MSADLRNIASIILFASVVLALALAARFGLVENAALVTDCAQAPERGCSALLAVRQTLVQSFVGGHLGWAAAAVAVLALFAGWRPAAWTAWVLGIAGTVLYNVEPASAAALLALLVLAGRPARQGQGGT